MKVYFLIAILLLFLEDQYFCKRPEVPPNDRGLSASGYVQLDTDELKQKQDLRRQYQAVEMALKHESERLRIKNLSDSGSDSGTETRIWVAFGLRYPRCLILKSIDKKKAKAVYITANGIRGGVATTPEGGFIHQNTLGAPKAGWDNLDKFLKDQGVSSPIQLSLDEQHLDDPDEESIVIEVKSGTQYSLVFFSRYTETADGRKAVAVCQRIEEEFKIRMGC